MKKEKCLHNDIFYMDLIQLDGLPQYIVKCNECEEYGFILLEEGENTFGLTLKEVEELKSYAI